jgi:selenide, water dikinase
MPPRHVEECSSIHIDLEGTDDDNEDRRDVTQDSTIEPERKRLVIVGGGHGHVQIIKALHRRARPSGLEVTLIDQQENANYSGMVPGCISGYYTAEETQLHLVPLARWADIKFLHGKVFDIDFETKCILAKKMMVENTDNESTVIEMIRFDVLSLDIGSTTRDFYSVPGAAEYTIPTRPIGELVDRVERATQALIHDDNVMNNNTKLVVIGAGIAGIELAMTIHARWQGLARNLNIVLLDASCHKTFLPGESEACRSKLLAILASKAIHVRFECGVKEITKNEIHLTSSSSDTIIPYTHCIWATGAGAHDLAWTLRDRGLAVDRHGWFSVMSIYKAHPIRLCLPPAIVPVTHNVHRKQECTPFAPDRF